MERFLKWIFLVIAVFFWGELFEDLAVRKEVDLSFKNGVESARFYEEDFYLLLTASLILCIMMTSMACLFWRVE